MWSTEPYELRAMAPCLRLEIVRPLAIIDTLFEAYQCDGRGREKEHFVRALKLSDEENYQLIPSLNEQQGLKAESLVRYRGMVRDVDHEDFACFLDKEVTKYREGPRDLSTSSGRGTRGVYHCMPLKGETWQQGLQLDCVVKLYDSDEESLQLCDTFEVVGIWFPFTSTIHGLLLRKLPFFHPMLPYSSRWLSEARLASALQRRLSPFARSDLRSLAVAILQSCLKDVLASEYVLALLVARVYGHNGHRALGRWTLNLTNWTYGSLLPFVKAVSQLAPRVVHLRVTKETLCKGHWKPRKDGKGLWPGELQLAPGTLLILDETELEVGEALDAVGEKNVKAIGSLASEQMLYIDLNGFEVHVPLEVNCLFISRGVSIFPADLLLPLRPTACPTVEFPSQLEAVRFYLGLMSQRTQPLRLQAIMSAFQADFAQLREEHRLREDTSHTWLSLLRCFFFLHGDEEMSLERWRNVASKEHQRCRRCQEEGLKA